MGSPGHLSGSRRPTSSSPRFRSGICRCKPDHDENYPPEAMALKEAIGQSDALLFVTHEVSSESTATFLPDFMAKFREHLVSRDGRN